MFDVDEMISDGDLVQIENVGTSSLLASSTLSDSKSTSLFEFFTSDDISLPTLYWIINSSEFNQNSIRCSSLISIQDTNHFTHIGVLDFLGVRTIRPFAQGNSLSSLWNITCVDEEDLFWEKGKPVQFKNVQYNCILSASFEKMTSSSKQNRWKLECGSDTSKATYWKVERGIFSSNRDDL